MAGADLSAVYEKFYNETEAIHAKFLAIVQDTACAGCQSAGFGEAILTAWLQTKWGEFSRELLIESLLCMYTANISVTATKTLGDAERTVTKTAREIAAKRGLPFPVWHSTGFVIEVAQEIALSNSTTIEHAIGPTTVPERITQFRNYLVHPTSRNRTKYEELLSKLGMLGKEPQELLHQSVRPGLVIFTSWIRELQFVSQASTNQ